MYHQKEEWIVNQLKAINKRGDSITLAKRTSNLFRSRKQIPSARLDFTNLNKVISIDTKKHIAEVEAATTYEDLVAETLKYQLVPAVVPQFTTITVGGGVSGGACEASSFKYGPTHETVEEMTILLSTGEVVTATRANRYRDLFLGIPNTFGSLGYILKMKIKLIPSLPFVKLQHIQFSDKKSYFSAIEQIMKTHKYKNEQVDYLDGVIFSNKQLYLTVGTFVSEAPFTSDYTYMKVFYQSIPKRTLDYLTVSDFIWRWDTDWAWGSKVFGMQNKVLRLLLGKWMLKSSSYWKVVKFERTYKIMEKVSKLTQQKRETVVQDTEIPIETSGRFLDFFLQNYTLRPLWICPMKSYQPFKFSFSPLKQKTFYINFGLWGSEALQKNHAGNYFNRLLETSVEDYHGHKALYSENFYTPTEFWKIYDKIRFDQLKNKYDPKNRLKDFYHKVCKEQE